MQISKVYLAPMEGVCDPPVRKILTRHGAYDECFSEFIRVTEEILPYKTLLREMPELENDCNTASGCQCRLQLLGDNPETVAGTAVLAEKLGAKSIDLNFGCPSRFVHHGGAMLLKEPDLIHEITARTRDALKSETFLSVKIRTGFLSYEELPEILDAVAVDGLNEIIIHARTRKDLYKKEALHWHALAEAHTYCRNIPLVANGDIVSAESSAECFRITGGIDRQMVGRGAFGRPDLPQLIKGLTTTPMPVHEVLSIALELCAELQSLNFPEKSCMDRLKQFIGYAHKTEESLSEFFRIFCRLQTTEEGIKALEEEADRLRREGREK